MGLAPPTPVAQSSTVAPPVDLRESVAATKASLDAVYSDRLMNSTCYHLHAVLVHQGQASGGHYWAYIRKPVYRPRSGRGSRSGDSTPVAPDAVADVELESQSETEVEDVTAQTGLTSGESDGETQCIVCEPESNGSNSELTGQTGSKAGETGPAAVEEEVWLKFNDVSVSEVAWAEVQRESYGGQQQNTSAYCLLYISSDMNSQQKASHQKGVELSPELQGYVDEDNTRFSKEMEEYDQKKREKLAQQVSAVE